jgi:hypothetical protein
VWVESSVGRPRARSFDSLTLTKPDSAPRPNPCYLRAAELGAGEDCDL